MAKSIYIGNLPYTADEDQVRGLFEPFGEVESVRLITDRDTGRPRGFGFVSMEEGADDAIAALNGKEMDGRALTVNEARPRREPGPRY